MNVRFYQRSANGNRQKISNDRQIFKPKEVLSVEKKSKKLKKIGEKRGKFRRRGDDLKNSSPAPPTSGPS